VLISIQINLRSLRLTPSMSTLVLLGNDLIISEIWTGPVFPSSNWGASMWGINDSGGVEVGGRYPRLFALPLRRKN
jgi:hypothetical protein